MLSRVQLNLSKSAITNKLEKDPKYFRERTKSSLIKGSKTIQTYELKEDNRSSIVYTD